MSVIIRRRSANWDEEEKNLLKVILKNYCHYTENKSLTTSAKKRKMKAWEEVHRRFNELSKQPRTIIQLQMQWKVMKMSARKRIAALKNRTVNRNECGKSPSSSNDYADVTQMATDINITIEADDTKQKTEVDDTDNIILSADTQSFTIVNGKAVEDCDDPIKVVSEKDLFQDSDSEDISKDGLVSPVMRTKSFNKNHAFRKKSTLSAVCKTNSYTIAMLKHSKILKDREHDARMKMASEEHTIKMKILNEKLKYMQIQRQILEMKKEHLAQHNCCEDMVESLTDFI